jgi:hypothetical protein
MGKIDDMRRLREQQFVEAEARVAKAAKAAPPKAEAPKAEPVAAPKAKLVDDEPAQPTRPTRPTKDKKTISSKSGAAIDEQGKCPECGKMKPLSNGVLANHQKGFGKACAGSRKKPV